MQLHLDKLDKQSNHLHRQSLRMLFHCMLPTYKWSKCVRAKHNRNTLKTNYYKPLSRRCTWVETVWRWPPQRSVPAADVQLGCAGWAGPGAGWGGPGAGGWPEGCQETPESFSLFPHTLPHSDFLHKNKNHHWQVNDSLQSSFKLREGSSL